MTIYEDTEDITTAEVEIEPTFEGFVDFPKGLCITQEGYSGTQDYDTEYLGFKQLSQYASVKLSLTFKSNEQLVEFMIWWDGALERGTGHFSTKTTLFGKYAKYGFRESSALVQTITGGVNKLSFTAEVIASEDIKNTLPTATPIRIILETNSSDNYIRLSGEDEDGDFLSYECDNNSALGFALRGTPPMVLYTPPADFIGEDHFDYFVKDKFGSSAPARVHIEVVEELVPDSVIRYTVDKLDDKKQGLIQGEHVSLSNEGLSHYKATLDGSGIFNLFFYADADVNDYAEITVDFDGFDPHIAEIRLQGYFDDSNIFFPFSEQIPVNDNGSFTVIVPIHEFNDTKNYVKLGFAYTKNEGDGIGTPTYTIDNIYTNKITKDPRITFEGNFWFKLGARWERASGSPIELPIGVNSIDVSSYDAIVKDNSRWRIRHVDIISMAKRQDIDDLCRDMENLLNVSVASDALGGTLKTMRRAFMNTPLLTSISKFDTSNVEDFEDFMNACGCKDLQPFDYRKGVNFVRAFKGSAIEHYGKIDSYQGLYFDEMFAYSSGKCITAIDTRKKISTTNMFTGTSFSSPTSAEQTAIVNGSGAFNGASCGVRINNISHVSGGVCDIPTFDGKCKSQARYKINVESGSTVGTLKYNWDVSNGVVLTPSPQGDNCLIESLESGVDITVYVGCTVTDEGTGKTVYSGVYSFIHKRPHSFAVLDYPVMSGKTNLTTWIKSKTSKKVIRITNNRVVPTIETGNLSGLTVEFINNGDIQAYSRSDGQLLAWEKTAFTVSAPIKLINNGKIMGAGCRAGAGGKGSNDTYTTSHTTQKYSFEKYQWQVRGANPPSRPKPDIVFWWNGGKTVLSSSTTKHSAGGYTWYKGDYVKKGIYRLKRYYKKTHSRTGGAGGNGGQGCGYGRSDVWTGSDRTGTAGKTSSPSGGYKGGAGGYGGWWGLSNSDYDGKRGEGNGAVGGKAYAAGNSLTGKSKLTSGSKLGTTYGRIL